MYRDQQRGVGLASAIFLLLVLGGLTVFLLNVSGLQHSSAALDVQGARAYQAARAGMEWGVYRALRNASCAGTSSFALSGGLSDFTVTVECSATPYTEVDATAKNIYSLRATACNRPAAGVCPGVSGPFYVERQLQALVDKEN
jgi:MSHA biogenesis protein MshP